MSGNGADLGSIYGAIVALGQKLDRQDGRLSRLGGDMASLRADLAGLLADVAAYHGSVMGHGVLISELDDRLRRVEQHLGLSQSA